jgi:hypothetical protein
VWLLATAVARQVAVEAAKLAVITAVAKAMTGWSWEESANAAGFARGTMVTFPTGAGPLLGSTGRTGYGNWTGGFSRTRNVSYGMSANIPRVTMTSGGQKASFNITGGARRADDISVSPQAPERLDSNRPIGKSQTQNASLQRRIDFITQHGAADIRVNQQQVNAAGQRVGINRPDLQYTYNGVRVYEEYDTFSSSRGADHAYRILSNDPNSFVNLYNMN